MKISICMVSLNCWQVLENCLDSLAESEHTFEMEIIMVDNGSTDGTVSKTRDKYPYVRIMENARNVGFTIATNQGIAASSGEYILWLNTDTVLRRDSLQRLWAYMEANEKVGIAGPMVLNADGSFQPQCRRGLPTILASLCYFAGLHRIFPKSRSCGEYLLTFLPIDKPAGVISVSGCCLMAKRRVLHDIGPLDEQIFGFGEDIEWCYRAHKAGWGVWYYPYSIIVHLKGKGGAHSQPFKKAFGIHQAMWLFYKKHMASKHPKFVSPLVRLGIECSYRLSLAKIWLLSCKRKMTC